MAAAKIAVVGIPTAAGARGPGPSEAPRRLREAGLLEALRGTGPGVVNLSDLSLFPFREDPEHPRARNAPVATCAAQAAADEMTRALAEGFTIVLGGDCTIVAGTVAGARRYLGQAVGLVFLDADADLNTPSTTPSGFLNGMALAHALGQGVAELAAAGGPPPAVAPEHVSLVGFRALDPGERAGLGALGLALPASAARTMGMKATAALAVDGVENGDGPILVHLDVDLLDPSVMPAKEPLTGGVGLSWEEASDLVTALLASPRVVALEVCEYNPDRDPGDACARKLVDLLARAVTRRFRA
ncbi:MAG TPA: arginase family protein [Vicinamibacteria bacterium]|nr:arginase family protein [Vicinamibacteria bacterium]